MRVALSCGLLVAGCATAPGPVTQAPDAAPPQARPSVPDQRWRGTMSCDPIPGLARKVLVQRVDIAVVAGVARYERPVLVADTNIDSGVRERGEGPVPASGALTLKGDARGNQYTYTAEYSGVLAPDRRTARLQGYQHWNFPHRPSVDRPCQLTLRRQS